MSQCLPGEPFCIVYMYYIYDIHTYIYTYIYIYIYIQQYEPAREKRARSLDEVRKFF